MWAAAIADLPGRIDGEIVCLADDINVIVSDEDPRRAKERMERAMEQLQEYLQSNQILLSPEKTQLLLIPKLVTKKSEEEASLACEMRGERITPKPTVKVLGAILDEQLT